MAAITTARGDVLPEGSTHWALEMAVNGGYGMSNNAFGGRVVPADEIVQHFHCDCCVGQRWFVVAQPGERQVGGTSADLSIASLKALVNLPSMSMWKAITAPRPWAAQQREDLLSGGTMTFDLSEVEKRIIAEEDEK